MYRNLLDERPNLYMALAVKSARSGLTEKVFFIA